MSTREWVIRQILGWLYYLCVVGTAIAFCVGLWAHSWPMILGSIAFSIAFRLITLLGLKLNGDL